MPPRAGMLKWGSLEIPWPRWAVGPTAMLVLLGLTGAGSWWAWEKFQDVSTRISPADLVQLTHAGLHITETPATALTVFDDPRGSLLLKWFQSDSCLLIERHFNDHTPTTTRFVPDMSRDIRAEAQPAPPFPFGAAPAMAHGRCLTLQEHGEPVKTWNEPIDACQVRAVRLYGDGCKAWAVWNGCASTWSAWAWEVCRH